MEVELNDNDKVNEEVFMMRYDACIRTMRVDDDLGLLMN